MDCRTRICNAYCVHINNFFLLLWFSIYIQIKEDWDKPRFWFFIYPQIKGDWDNSELENMTE